MTAPGTPLVIAVVQGGPSTEAEVSRASAAGVARALAEAGHAPVRLELDAGLAGALLAGAGERPFDVVFPVVHGAVGEDGSLQGLLEVLGMAYVGSGVLASALAMKKPVARALFERAGLPVAKGIAVPRPAGGIAQAAAAAAARARRDIGGRVVVKPAAHGSAIGVARIEDRALDADVARAIEAVWAIDDVALVEHFARGREVTCGVLERGVEPGGATALPPTEIRATSDAFYTFEARYAPGRSAHVCPADLGPAVTRAVQAAAAGAHAALGCRDLSRVDFIVGDDGAPDAITLLEVNTLPGMTATSLFPEAAGVAGITMASLCAGLAERAYARGPTPRNAPRAMPV